MLTRRLLRIDYKKQPSHRFDSWSILHHDIELLTCYRSAQRSGEIQFCTICCAVDETCHRCPERDVCHVRRGRSRVVRNGFFCQIYAQMPRGSIKQQILEGI